MQAIQNLDNRNHICAERKAEESKMNRDQVVKTSANTPKSEPLKSDKLEVEYGHNKIECNSEEVKSKDQKNLFTPLMFEKSPGSCNLAILMKQCINTRSCRIWFRCNHLCILWLPFFKRSFNGLTPFNQISPKGTDLQLYRKTVGLCGKHFEQTGLNVYISQSESESEEEEPIPGVPEFLLQDFDKEDVSDIQSFCDKKIHKNALSDADLLECTFNDNEEPNLLEDLADERVLDNTPKIDKQKANKKAKKCSNSKSKPIIRGKRFKTGEDTELPIFCNDNNCFETLLNSKFNISGAVQKTSKVTSKNGDKNDSNSMRKRKVKNNVQDQKTSSIRKNQLSNIRKSTSLMNKEANLSECKGCTCKRSKCIKLYCECFLSKGFCGPSCTCNDCENMEENEEEIVKIREKILSRNPKAFEKKLQIEEASQPLGMGPKAASAPSSNLRHIKGCTCKRSKCSNNYCECHQHGAKCTELCSCTDCNNGSD
uniref:CRC domain-containing protein n=1 Tax=Euplotes vannus TaxID=5939 RepID=Q6A1N6_EUPVA|nr:hypothetical protein [Euplotes vannus]